MNLTPQNSSGDDLLDDELIEEYLHDCREALREARENVRRLSARTKAAESVHSLREFGHKLGGSGGTYGFDEAGRQGRLLEKLMKDVLSGQRKADARTAEEILTRLKSITENLGL